jgi:hypothetical protein
MRRKKSEKESEPKEGARRSKATETLGGISDWKL